MQISFFVLVFYLFAHQSHTLQNSFREGDIIFQTSQSSLSKAIQLATQSKYSHVGVIFKQDNRYMVLEAIQPVQITPLQEWIDRGAGSHYIVKRLKNADKVLDKNTIEKMRSIGKKYVGKDYDIYFAWTDERLYCSELVWKIYKEATGIEIGALKSLKEFDLNPALVRQKLKEHYGKNVPLDEKIISPDAMFQSDLLEVIDSQ